MAGNIQEISTFGFDNEDSSHILKVYGSSDEPWFRASDVGKALGYSNIREIIRKLDLNPEWVRVNESDTNGLSRQSTFINESALYCVIMKSNKKIAKAFRDWVCGTVLPTIRKTGKFVDPTQVIDNRLTMYKTVFDVFNTIGMDARDEVMFKDYGRTLLLTDGSDIHKEMSLSRRLQEKFGITTPKRQLLITLGKHIAQRYRHIHGGDDPVQREQYVDGTVRRVNHYTVDEFNEYIDQVILEHLRKTKMISYPEDEIVKIEN